MNFTELQNQSQLAEMFEMVLLAFMRSFGPLKNPHYAFYRGATISLISVDSYIKQS